MRRRLQCSNARKHAIYFLINEWGFIVKQHYFILIAAMGAAMAGASATLLAQPVAISTTLANLSTEEAPRITQAVNDHARVTIPKTHLSFVAQQASSSTPLPDEATMNHLQLVLKPSAARQAAMETLIASQHDPKSAQFDQWIAPQQFGEAFGVVDRDIATVTAWLTSQGFKVNGVYPNKMQIDFSGNVAQVTQAFHIQEILYTNKQGTHLSNASDISVPAALQPLVSGVMGLNDFLNGPHTTTSLKSPKLVRWDASKKTFVRIAKTSTGEAVDPKSISQAISFAGGTERLLVPNDMVTMYGIRKIRNNGVTGKGITIADIEDNDMQSSEWTNFVNVFNLAQYGGTFQQIHPAPANGTNNCVDPGPLSETGEALLDTEWVTAIAPGATVEVASCSSYDAHYNPESSNTFGGVFIAATNLINGANRPDIIDVGAAHSISEIYVDNASKTAIDLMWAQADAEGVSVFVATGDTGIEANTNIASSDPSAINVNGLATSTHVTAVGGTDLADVLRGTTRQYFAATPSVVGGSALSYVPEVPFNSSCGNGVAAKAFGFSSAVAFCADSLKYDPYAEYASSLATSGGPSSVDAKPAWQRLVFNAAADQSRDLPDVSLFAGSWGYYTMAIVCTSSFPCTSDFSGSLAWDQSTSLSSSMFAGIQALMDQGLAARGLPVDQGNAAPALYALAADEYGGPTGPAPASLAACSADNGASGTGNCAFHNVTSGSTSINCFQSLHGLYTFTNSNCYFYGNALIYGPAEPGQIGLTTTDTTPTSYGTSNKAYGAQPGWSFASGLGSVDATNLLIAWRAYAKALSAP
ncbi:MAG TPA: protease pro-enzyme activation domain-containing protein [Rhodanobacter sp.]